MLTIFAVPKAFSGHTAVIQENAIRSWTRLACEPEIVLFGDEAGVAAAAAELGVRHEPDLDRNAYGTPLLGDLFGRARELATHDRLCYVNADVILIGDVAAALAAVRRFGPAGVLTGRRWRARFDGRLTFDPGWERDVLERAHAGWLDVFGAMDWMSFDRTRFADVPAFAIGRTRWDAWLLTDAQRDEGKLVDATDAIVAVHQEHRERGDAEKAEMRLGPEATRNRELAAGARGSIADARWRLTDGGLKRAYDPARLRWRLYSLRLSRGPEGLPSRALQRLVGVERFQRWLAG